MIIIIATFFNFDLFTYFFFFIFSDWWIREWTKAYSNISNQVHEFISSAIFSLTMSLSSLSSSSSSSSFSFHSSFIPDNNNNDIQLSNNILSQNVSSLFPLSNNNDSDGQSVDVNYYLGIYILIGFLTALLASFKAYYMFSGSLDASKKLHSAILDKILLAKIRFFDTTPMGRSYLLLFIYFFLIYVCIFFFSSLFFFNLIYRKDNE